jgi:hypothetical protein
MTLPCISHREHRVLREPKKAKTSGAIPFALLVSEPSEDSRARRACPEPVEGARARDMLKA